MKIHIFKRPALVILLNLLLTLILVTSCRQIEPNTSITTFPSEMPVAGDSGVDEIGKYIIYSELSSNSEDGFLLRIEERLYEDLSKSRFIVTRSRIESQLQSINVKNIDFSVYQGNEQVSTNNLDPNQLLKSANTDSLSITSQIIFASELYDFRYDDSEPTLAELYNSGKELAKKSCGIVKLDYVDENFYPIVLDTCYRPSGN